MNEKLIRTIKKEMNITEQTNKYYNLYPYAYSNNFIIRYIFMNLLLSNNNNLDIEELYEDNIGLRAIVEITDSDVIEKAKKKKLRGWSFGFSCNKDEEVINKNGLREF